VADTGGILAPRSNKMTVRSPPVARVRPSGANTTAHTVSVVAWNARRHRLEGAVAALDALSARPQTSVSRHPAE
jgi:hypothetical protein